MKLPAFLSLLAAGCCAIGASAEGQGVWLEQKHDFGAFDEGLGTVYCDFRLVNTGNEPIAIINARANCGCTRPEYSRDPIAPATLPSYVSALIRKDVRADFINMSTSTSTPSPNVLRSQSTGQ